MGFNYLQTDDRDDYFAQFSKKPKKKLLGLTLIDPDGKVLFDNERLYKLRHYAKKKYLEPSKSGKYIWGKLLKEKGYKIIKNYE